MSNRIVCVFCVAAIVLSAVGIAAGCSANGPDEVMSTETGGGSAQLAPSGGKLEATADWVDYGDGGGAVVGVMTNSGDTALVPDITLEYVAADGEASSQKALRGKHHLMSGESSHFAVWFAEKPQSFKVVAESEEAITPAKVPSFGLTQDNLSAADFRHTGKVQNTGTEEVSGVAVQVTYFDASGEAIAVAETECFPSDLAPGAQADFEIMLGSEAPLVDRAEVNVEAYWMD